MAAAEVALLARGGQSALAVKSEDGNLGGGRPQTQKAPDGECRPGLVSS